ncbi:hypothetical protein KP77_25410 [Jeotgalibacillus alimentarius]|uniref:Uncharacterized protein n=1 Tax=Jeotgalibacillus alimentarius TaxID=135826 RepID=A0A0C2VDF8_9BACL|nr:hypothetical protein [Jeotgalibacillus alimentarius]KIL46972.1 hypothetical protein KP77_25410 [Jeotgalibacillus alimentarius]
MHYTIYSGDEEIGCVKGSMAKKIIEHRFSQGYEFKETPESSCEDCVQENHEFDV